MSRRFIRMSSPDQARKIFEKLGGDLKLGGMNVTVGGYDLVFLEEAKRAATRSLRASRRGEPRLEAGGAAAAVLCAAAACEARVSEFLTRWEAQGTLGQFFVNEKRKQVERAFDIIIATERAKR